MGIGVMSNIVVDKTVLSIVVIVRLVHYRGRRPRRSIVDWEMP